MVSMHIGGKDDNPDRNDFDNWKKRYIYIYLLDI